MQGVANQLARPRNAPGRRQLAAAPHCGNGMAWRGMAWRGMAWRWAALQPAGGWIWRHPGMTWHCAG
eukprot:1711782-Lingulodinium_polyedra.AAC.1